MKKINILDENTINKIAAGEVIERPASVVKELVENSIDANSKNIIIEIKKSGKSLIRITDDGDGIDSKQVEKAFLRHATSKIIEIDDLQKCYSLGFRGEALASICSVSRLTVITKTEYENVGIKIIFEGGKMISKESVATRKGTTILIEDLFFNTPVRKKFLKTDRAETTEINSIVQRLILSNYKIQFNYIVDGKVSLNTYSSNNALLCIKELFGKDIYKNLIQYNKHFDGFEINGYVSNSSLYKNRKSHLYIYVNNRLIRESIVHKAVISAYINLIPISRFPICFLYIKVDPSKVDVNVHPSKAEIKFENSTDIFNMISRDLRNFITYNALLPTDSLDNLNKLEKLNPFKFEEKKDNTKEYASNFIDMESYSKEEKIPFFEINIENPFEEKKQNQREYSEIQQEINISSDENTYKIENFSFDFSEYIGVFLKTYIIYQYKHSMFLIDQHAAHERILFEKYMNDLKNKKVDEQILLDPLILNLDFDELDTVENNFSFLKECGFEIEWFGSKNLILRSVPYIFDEPSGKEFVLDFLKAIKEEKNIVETKYLKIATMACKAALKAHDFIEKTQSDYILKELKNCKNPFTCPHGRPIIVELTKESIEKMFKRII